MRNAHIFPVLVFDLDGTLVDSAPEIGAALNALLAERNLPPMTGEQLRAFVGDGAARLVERSFAAGGTILAGDALAEATVRYLAIYEETPPDPDSLYPGVAETLSLLRADGHRLGLCTNKPERATRIILEALDLAGHFQAVAGGDSTPARKPDPRHLSWVLDRMAVPPSSAVMIGDNANDTGAARAAGVASIAVSYGYPRMPVAELGADLVIDRFSDLPGALARLGQAGGRGAG